MKKTIEERAREFVETAANGQDVPDYINELLVECYCIAAMEERKLLTEWHDPEDYPEHQDSVLLKVNNAEYNIGHYNTEAKEWRDSHTYNRISIFDFIGWREIHKHE